MRVPEGGGRNHDRVLKSCSYKVFSPQKFKQISQEQAAAAVTIAIISEKNKSKEKRKKKSLCETLP